MVDFIAKAVFISAERDDVALKPCDLVERFVELLPCFLVHSAQVLLRLLFQPDLYSRRLPLSKL